MQDFLEKNKEPKYKIFLEKLIKSRYEILGVRAPKLKKFAKNIQKEQRFDEFFQDFLNARKNFEHLQIIAYGINYEKDLQNAKNYCKKYLNFVDNWANCDSLSPAVFKNLLEIDFALELLKHPHTYTQRFGILYLMKFCSCEDALRAICEHKSSETHVNMARAWALQQLFIKDFAATLNHLSQHPLDPATKKMLARKIKDSQALIQKPLILNILK